MVLEWTPEEASLLQDRPFSAEESLRDSEPSDINFSYWVPEHQETGYFMRSECINVLVSFTLISHIVSCMLH